MPPKTSFKSPATPPHSRKSRIQSSSSNSSTANPNRDPPSPPLDDGLADIGDESDLMNLSTDLHKISLAASSITDTPSPNKLTSRKASQKPTRSRPSWGPAPSTSNNKALSNTRLMDGLDTSSLNTSNSASASATGGPRLGGMATSKTGARPRFSLFAKPNPVGATSRSHHTNAPLEEVEGSPSKENEVADESFLGEVKTDSASNIQSQPHSNHPEPTKTDPSQQESQEQVSNQLQELRRMNDTFEQYEMGLLGVHAQMETFSDRIMSTSRLLDIYIDLLRQSERTQKLLLDPDWKGATEDESAHAEMLAQARCDEARARAEAELAAAQAAEEARLEAERLREAEERKKLMDSKSSSRGRGSARGAVRGGTAIRGASARGASTTARGGSTATRGRTTSSIPARSTSGSGIGRPSTVSSSTRGRTASTGTTGAASARGTVRSSGYGPK